MIEGKVLILSSEDVDSHKAFEKVTDFKAEAYAKMAHFDVVLLVESDRTVIVKNRHGHTGIAPAK